MKKIVRLTERDLTKLVKRVINENKVDALYAEKIISMIDKFNMTCQGAVEDAFDEYYEILRELESDDKITSHSRSYSRLNDILGNFMHYMVGDVKRSLEPENNKMLNHSFDELRDIIDNK